jgi:hypothetical protein
LLKAGGDFNQIDDFGFTPLAYGTQDLLKSLGLFNGVVSVNLDTKQPFTPNFDNNAYPILYFFRIFYFYIFKYIETIFSI